MIARADNPTLPLARIAAQDGLKRAGFTELTSLKRTNDSMDEARHGALPSFDTVEALMADLDEEEILP
jgi:hypothetical protein